MNNKTNLEVKAENAFWANSEAPFATRQVS
jgi:hypothetical protein